MENETSYYSRNRDARRAYQKKYYKNNRDGIKIKRKYAELDNPELEAARKEYNSNYYKNNKNKILARRRELYRAKKTLK